MNQLFLMHFLCMILLFRLGSTSVLPYRCVCKWCGATLMRLLNDRSWANKMQIQQFTGQRPLSFLNWSFFYALSCLSFWPCLLISTSRYYLLIESATYSSSHPYKSVSLNSTLKQINNDHCKLAINKVHWFPKWTGEVKSCTDWRCQGIYELCVLVNQLQCTHHLFICYWLSSNIIKTHCQQFLPYIYTFKIHTFNCDFLYIREGHSPGITHR